MSEQFVGHGGHCDVSQLREASYAASAPASRKYASIDPSSARHASFGASTIASPVSPSGNPPSPPSEQLQDSQTSWPAMHENERVQPGLHAPHNAASQAAPDGPSVVLAASTETSCWPASSTPESCAGHASPHALELAATSPPQACNSSAAKGRKETRGGRHRWIECNGLILRDSGTESWSGRSPFRSTANARASAIARACRRCKSGAHRR